MQKFRLASEFGKIRTGSKACLRLCRLPVRPPKWPSPAHTKEIADLTTETKGPFDPSGLSGWAVHVPDRSANSHRETSLPRQATHETHTVASQKQLESFRWLEEDNVLPGQPLHPLKHALQIFTVVSKEGWALT